MVIVNAGLNRIRDMVADDIFKGQAGTGADAPSPNDTALTTPDSATLKTVTLDNVDRSTRITFLIPATTGNGTSYSEFEIQMNNGNTQFLHGVFAPLTKGSKDEFTLLTNVLYDRQ